MTDRDRVSRLRSLWRTCVFALVSCAIVTGETYRVDGVSGSDENDGVTKPFKTIGRVLRSLKTSDTLMLAKMDEPYREALRLRVGGTPERPLVVEGNGATLSGADPAPKTGWVEANGVYSLAQPTQVKFLFGPNMRCERGKSATELDTQHWWWENGKLYFRPAEGKTPGDYDLEMAVRTSGVATNGTGQIIVRNLTCKHFWNDGFNIHGGSAPLWFENVVGVWNGDEGFSAHENAECYVRGGDFSNNYWHGIADINFSRTHYANIIVRNNRSKGIYFTGGMHSVTDSEVSGSPVNIALIGGVTKHFPRHEMHPLHTSFANFRNVVVRSEPNEVGVFVQQGSEAVFEHCLISGGQTCVRVDSDAKAFVTNSIVHGAKDAEVKSEGSYVAFHNLYHPGRFMIGARAYAPDDFDGYRTASGNDDNSFIEEPKFIGDTLWLSRASRGKGKAAGGRGFGGLDIGLGLHGTQPHEAASIVPAEATRTETGRVRFTYDFEKQNPWSRVYPVPAKSKAGQKVDGVSDLSDEQAHSGARSAKLTVKLPAGAPPRYTIKLFSIKLPYDRPVCAVRYWLYGDGSGRSAKLRVRDRHGECFYDTPVRVDWSGWRQIKWDLDERPPCLVSAGDGNRTQDGPPMEVVVEISAKADSEVTLYFDDLEVELSAGETLFGP